MCSSDLFEPLLSPMPEGVGGPDDVPPKISSLEIARPGSGAGPRSEFSESASVLNSALSCVAAASASLSASLSATPIQPRPVEPRHVDRAANMACEERSSGRGCGLGGWEGERWERCNARVVACMYDGAVSSHTQQHEAVRDTSLPRPTGTHGNWPAQPATDQLVVDFLESAARAGRSSLPAPLEDAASGGARRWPLGVRTGERFVFTR